MTETPASQRGWGPGWPNCQADKMVTIHPVGRAITCRHEMAAIFDYLVRRYDYEIEDINAVPDDGAFACRPIRGSNPPIASNHSWGLALDLNWNKHPRGDAHTFTSAQLLAGHIMLSELHFFRWGQDYEHSPVDGMHWEFLGTVADAATLTKRIQHLLPWMSFPGEFGKGNGGHEGNLVRSRLGQHQTLTGKLDSTSVSLLRAFKVQRHLPLTDVVDAKTWAHLEWRLP